MYDDDLEFYIRQLEHDLRNLEYAMQEKIYQTEENRKARRNLKSAISRYKTKRRKK